jgi:hypothetical protein
MRLRPVVVWVLAPAAVAGVAFAVNLAVRGDGLRRAAEPALGSPAVEWTRTVDLGEREVGELAVGQVRVVNRGSGELVIDQPTSNCVCAGLEQVRDGAYRPLESLRLAPGEAAELAVRVQVKGVPGMTFRTVVSFRTNDPTSPHPAIDVIIARVRGGLSTVPTAATFGPTAVGTEAVQVLDIRDGAKPPRSIRRVESASPDVTARLLPAPAEPEAEPHPAGALVGRVEVTMRPGEVGPLNSVVRVYTDGEPNPLTVPITGRGAALVEAVPSAFVLHRSSGNGPVYTGACLCRSVEGKPLKLSVASAPEGLSVDLLGESGTAVRQVRVTWDPKRGRGLAGRGPVPVKLTADVGGRAVDLELQVVCREGGGT